MRILLSMLMCLLAVPALAETITQQFLSEAEGKRSAMFNNAACYMHWQKESHLLADRIRQNEVSFEEVKQELAGIRSMMTRFEHATRLLARELWVCRSFDPCTFEHTLKPVYDYVLANSFVPDVELQKERCAGGVV